MDIKSEKGENKIDYLKVLSSLTNKPSGREVKRKSHEMTVNFENKINIENKISFELIRYMSLEEEMPGREVMQIF